MKTLINIVITMSLILALFVIGIMIGIQEGISYQQSKINQCHRIILGDVK
jgi:hypothetical protein